MRLKRTIYVGSARIHPLMNIPVPCVFMLTFLAGTGLQRLLPVRIHSATVLLLCHVAGMVLTAGGVLLAATGLGLFRAARTTTIPYETASKLVTWGPYRFSRNPMYVSLTLTYLGVAGIKAQVWPLLLLPLVVAYLQRIVIPFEEARLRDVFGEAYGRYCGRVSRWM